MNFMESLSLTSGSHNCRQTNLEVELFVSLLGEVILCKFEHLWDGGGRFSRLRDLEDKGNLTFLTWECGR